MPNALAWLTGRDDLTGQPDLPFGIDSERLLARSPLDLGVQNPVLAPYYPSPSERFSGWISDLLGAGPGASLAKQNFATGVPNLLQATPLGIGLSAADLLHAKAADDPAGVAAAAIGMVPGVGGEARAAKNLIPWQDEADKVVKIIEHALAGKPAPQFHSEPSGGAAAPVDIWKVDPKMLQIGQQVTAGPGGAVGTFNGISPGGTTLVNWKKAVPKNDTDVVLSAIHDAMNSPDIAKTFASTGPGVAPAMPATTTGAKPPIYDYQKDDNGLYHIFDIESGKTKAVKDTVLEAKSWINEQKAKSLGMPLVKNPFTVQENLGGFYDIVHSGTGQTHGTYFDSKMDAENEAKKLFNESQSGVKTIPITESKSLAAKPFDEVANKNYPQLPNYWKPNPAFDSKVTGLIRKDFSPVDWKNYTPPNARNEAVTPKLAVDPSHVESLGGNPNLALWKGGSIAGYPKELPDMTGKVVPNNGEPAKEKFEKAFFLADRPSVADSYIVDHDKGPSPYVALPKSVVETDWTDLAKKFKQYAPQATSAAHYSPILMKYIIDAAREHGADMAIVHNIHDLGGPQTQYVVLNTNALRAPTAKFDPSKLHLRYPLAGLAGAGIYTAAEEGEEKQ